MKTELVQSTQEIEYAGTQEAMDAAIADARHRDMDIVFGEPNTLLLDLDDGARINGEVLVKVVEQFGEYTTEGWTSQGGKGRHVVMRFAVAQFTPAEALALEAALGSDPRRTVFGVARLRRGVVQPRMLFRPKEGNQGTLDLSKFGDEPL